MMRMTASSSQMKSDYSADGVDSAASDDDDDDDDGLVAALFLC